MAEIESSPVSPAASIPTIPSATHSGLCTTTAMPHWCCSSDSRVALVRLFWSERCLLGTPLTGTMWQRPGPDRDIFTSCRFQPALAGPGPG